MARTQWPIKSTKSELWLAKYNWAPQTLYKLPWHCSPPGESQAFPFSPDK